jgi:Cft2 family RNA processing exonuclease
VLGSAGVLLTFQENGTERRVFYTSDTNLRAQSIIPGGEYPDPPIDILILESTLGADPDAEQTTRRTEEQRFAESLKRVIERGGTVLIPAFVLGRAQEVLALLDRFKQRGYLPEDLLIYTAGSMRAIADLYDKTRYSTPRLNEDFQVFGVPQKRLPRSSARVQEILNQPGIHVVGSGMMFENTLSNKLGQQIVGDAKNAVFFVGYAREDSPAHRLQEAVAAGPGTEVVLDESAGSQPVYCDVERFRFSGHSNRRDLIEIVERLQPNKVILVHGEHSAREWMADNIKYFYPDTEVFSPNLGEVLEV